MRGHFLSRALCPAIVAAVLPAPVQKRTYYVTAWRRSRADTNDSAQRDNWTPCPATGNSCPPSGSPIYMHDATSLKDVHLGIVLLSLFSTSSNRLVRCCSLFMPSVFPSAKEAVFCLCGFVCRRNNSKSCDILVRVCGYIGGLAAHPTKFWQGEEISNRYISAMSTDKLVIAFHFSRTVDSPCTLFTFTYLLRCVA